MVLNLILICCLTIPIHWFFIERQHAGLYAQILIFLALHNTTYGLNCRHQETFFTTLKVNCLAIVRKQK